jgi:phosphoribosylanthranilate isomerase
MRVRVKICGITDTEALTAAVEAGADAVGFVLDPSPRQLTVAQAAALRAQVPSDIDTVAVVGRPDLAAILEVQDALSPSWIQLMADALPDPVSARGLRLLPAFEDGEDLVQRVAHYCAGRTDERPLVLADGPRAGSGQTGDWNRVTALCDTTRLILAGGLTPENVGAAIAKVRPYAVDVSSGVERVRGQKDPDRIRAFLAAVRAAEQATGGDR